MNGPSVRRVRAGDERAYREMRLRALRLAPDAFNTTYEEALARRDDEWSALVIRGSSAHDMAAFVLDRGDGTLAGSAFATAVAEAPELAEVFQVWLDEDLRGGRWADDLMATAEAFALALGVKVVQLWVDSGNGRARRFYERVGYRATGETEPAARGRTQVLMRKELAR